jgi:deoxyribose-phosphate aldolase
MPTKTVVPELTIETLGRTIELSVLAPDHTLQDVDSACEAAVTHGLASVCVAPYVVERAVRLLRGTPVKVCGTVGIPLGYSGLAAKVSETRTAIEAGAAEIDMVINLVAMKSGRYGDVRAEIEAIRRLTAGCTLKVILECCYLTDTEKARGCEYAREAGADYIVTNTGFGKGGARLRDIELVRRLTGRRMRIKAAGGIASFSQVREFLRVGATRIGTSDAATIIKEFYAAELD